MASAFPWLLRPSFFHLSGALDNWSVCRPEITCETLWCGLLEATSDCNSMCACLHATIYSLSETVTAVEVGVPKLGNCLEMYTCAKASVQFLHSMCTNLDTPCTLGTTAWLPLAHWSCIHACAQTWAHQACSQGAHSNPPFGLQKILYAPLNCNFECPTVQNWFSSFHAIENHRRPKKFVIEGPARNPRVSCLRRCYERTHVNTRINKSLFRALESLPVVLLVISPHLMFYQP